MDIPNCILAVNKNKMSQAKETDAADGVKEYAILNRNH